MALDQVMWESARRPALRIYQWDHPALSFGYFGEFKEVAQYRGERELVRRCTGGGIVFHGADLTYALVVPATERVNAESSLAIYEFVHRAIVQTMRVCDIPATLLPQTDGRRFALRNATPTTETISGGVAQRATSTGACFANPVVADVMMGEQKIAGAAQRRSRGGLLQQGSIQNVQLSRDFGDRFARALCSNVVPCVIGAKLLGQAARLSESKYAAEDWLKRR